MIRAAAVAAVAALALAACTGGEPEPEPEPAETTGTAAPSPAGCTEYAYEGAVLGVTLPPGFVSTGPAEETFGGISTLELASLQEDGTPGGLGVYAFADAARDNTALAVEAAVARFQSSVRATTSGPIPVTPTPVAGLDGLAGGAGDTRAFGASDADPAAFRWWSLPVGEAHFVVALGARPATRAESLAAPLAEALRPGGC